MYFWIFGSWGGTRYLFRVLSSESLGTTVPQSLITLWFSCKHEWVCKTFSICNLFNEITYVWRYSGDTTVNYNEVEMICRFVSQQKPVSIAFCSEPAPFFWIVYMATEQTRLQLFVHKGQCKVSSLEDGSFCWRLGCSSLSACRFNISNVSLQSYWSKKAESVNTFPTLLNLLSLVNRISLSCTSSCQSAYDTFVV